MNVDYGGGDVIPNSIEIGALFRWNSFGDRRMCWLVAIIKQKSGGANCTCKTHGSAPQGGSAILGKPSNPANNVEQLAKGGSGSSLNDLQKLNEASSHEDLLPGGFPLVSEPRKAAIEQVRGKSLPELVQDWANIEHVALTVEGSMLLTWELDSLNETMPNNLYVLRIIEEGRAHPKEVEGVIIAQLNLELDRYAELSKLPDLQARMSSESDRARDEMKYYRENMRYQSSRLEMSRIIRSIYQSFYALIAINQLGDTAPLHRWISSLDDDRGGVDIDVWIVDQYVERGGLKGGPKGDGWRENSRGVVLSDTKMFARSAWNETWSFSDPLVAIRRVNTSTLRKIEVPLLPKRIPVDGAAMSWIEKRELLRFYSKEK